jgi:hypothetical protein
MPGLNPSIEAEVTRKALSTEQVAAANVHDLSVERVALDEAELQDLEQAEYYGETPAASKPTTSHRSYIDRLFRRRPR